jgi:hypothetical protein
MPDHKRIGLPSVPQSAIFPLFCEDIVIVITVRRRDLRLASKLRARLENVPLVNMS